MSAEEGPLVTQAYVCAGKGEKLVLKDITLPAMTATQVQLDITHCGLCHTDIHMRGQYQHCSDPTTKTTMQISSCSLCYGCFLLQTMIGASATTPWFLDMKVWASLRRLDLPSRDWSLATALVSPGSGIHVDAAAHAWKAVKTCKCTSSLHLPTIWGNLPYNTLLTTDDYVVFY